jgi:amino acid adenylation domain-containing protein
VFRRHEALRTVFTTIDNQPIQIINPYSEAMINRSLVEHDLRNLHESEQQARALELAQDVFRAPFDLKTGPLTRLALLQIGDRENVFLICMQHIVSDAWSLNRLAFEIIALYNGLVIGKQDILPALTAQYADYAAWQRDWLRGDVLENLLSYWRAQLDRVSVLELSTDHPRPLIQTYRGKAEVLPLPEEIFNHLKRLSHQENVTLFMTLLAAFFALLHRYTAQTDIAVGCPIANRNRMETEPLIGMLVNTLVIRLDLTGEPTFRELLQRLRRVVLEAYDHQDLPYSVMASKLHPERDTRFTPFTQVMFSLIDVPIPALNLDGITTEIQFDRHGAQFDLTMSVTDLPFEKSISIEYNTDLFEAETIKRMMAHYCNLLQGIIFDPLQSTARLPMLHETERHQLLVEWNKTQRKFPEHTCIHELIEAQVQATPDKIALSFENQNLTYAQMNMKANQLAHFLLKKGVKAGTLVGIHLPRSLDLVIAVLGILKTGAFFVPLDPSYPALRLVFMITDSDTTLVLSQSNLAEAFAEQDIEVIFLDQEEERISLEPSENPACEVISNDLAYVIYTSGSTGKPKGVPICHRSVVNFLTSMRERPGITPDAVLLAITTLSFDISMLELLLPLIAGAKVVLGKSEIINDGQLLSQIISEQGVTVMQATPATWNLMLEAGWGGDHRLKILCGGEPLTRDLANQLLSRCAELWNMYGPTETTIWSSIEQVLSAEETITIGRPIANTEMYILDGSLGPVPVGVAGMLFIGGEGVSDGYLNRPELNSQKFILNPFKPGSQLRLFSTGDLARYLPDGRIECLGRNDNQIKMYGFRIELGEIEAVLSDHPAVQSCVVIVNESVTGQKSLVAYIIPKYEQLPPSGELRTFLRAKLPNYMIPSSFVSLKTFPYTPSGKLDRQALRALSSPPDDGYLAPRNEIERELVKIWEEVLDTNLIGVNRNFFEMGGFSLQALRLLNKVEELFGIRLPIATIFQYPTVESMAHIIDSKVEQPDWSLLVPIQPNGIKPPIFCIHGAGGGVIGYSRLAHRLGMDQPLYGLQSKGFDDNQEPQDQIEDMARTYLKEIRTIQPRGPYYLLGYSFGGIVAYELACQIRAQDENVALLAILDAYILSRSEAIKQLWRPKNLIKFILNLPAWLIDQWQNRFSRNYKQEIPKEHKKVFQAHVNSMVKYRPGVYDGKVTLFRVSTMSLLRSFDPEFGWERLAKDGVETHLIPGSHSNLLDDLYVEELARLLASCIDRASSQRSEALQKR